MEKEQSKGFVYPSNQKLKKQMQYANLHSG